MEIPCREPGCREKVEYQREPIFGIYTRTEAFAGKKTVYLTCPAGHEHVYTVDGG